MSRTSIALATTRPRPEINVDHDMTLLIEALGAAGADAVAAEWDDPQVDWAKFDLVIVRSAWDYTWRSQEFFAWVTRCSSLTRIANTPAVMSWSADKHYVGALAEAGVPVVPTRYLPPGHPIELPQDQEFVIKPVIGAGARFAARYRPEQQAEALEQLRLMHADRLTAMVQPYMGQIESSGERALVFVAGRFLHAIRKNPVLSPGVRYDERKVAHPGVRPWSPTEAELALAERALAVVPGEADLLYARVDMVDDGNGNPVVLELELVEPNLFLFLQPSSLATAAEAFTAAANCAAVVAQEGALHEGQAAIAQL
jgi:glutathione synthase/RimK-type ligase-like ATP-grasp enzyme